MELTMKEMEILATDYPEANEYSLFNNLGKIRGEGSRESLAKKGVYQNGIINPTMKALLDILAYPERVARFRLEQVEVNMRKQAFAIGDKAILVEFHRENVIISTLDSELESVRAEIANHTGVAFQKHSQLDRIFKGDQLICFAALSDWLRRIALSELTGDRINEVLTLERFQEFLQKPLKLGLQSQIQSLTHLPTPPAEAVKTALQELQTIGLVETIEPKLEAGKSTILLAINFLVPNMAISLELYDLTVGEKVLMAREQIIQAAPKDNLSISAAVGGYAAKSLTAVEVLDKIIGYLSLPSLAQSLS